MQQKSLSGTGPALFDIGTFATPEPITWPRSTSFAAGSRVRTSASQAAAPDSTASGLAYGPSSGGSFANFDRASLSWKTSQRSWDEDSERYSETWPRAGMTRSGTAYQRQPLAPLTDGTGSGLWPTPTATDYKGSTAVGLRRGTLAEAAENLPPWILCPCCGENYLCTVHMMHAFECPCPSVDAWPSDPYTARVPGRLHPEFTEWLQGFPIGWTACDA
jgi:hypothetical protein